MRIKICGLFRDQDIDYVNEARPDYAGFVFAQSKRRVTPVMAQYLRFRLADGIIPVGVFLNARISEIVELYRNGVISIAQLHGDEDDSYITGLKRKSSINSPATGGKPIPVIKALKYSSLTSFVSTNAPFGIDCADYLLIDSGAGSGKPFDWKSLDSIKFNKPWFLAGGINNDNIKQAIALNPFSIDVSSGAETDGVKNREKILYLTNVTKGKI